MPSSVAPGQQVTLNFTVTAPSTSGSYNFQWRMVHDGVVWFGDTSPNVLVSVSATPPAGDTTYRFEDVSANDAAINGTHGGIDFGTNKWFYFSAYAGLNRYAYMSGTTVQTFVLPSGNVLRKITLSSAAPGTYSVSDGVNPAITGAFTVDTPVVITTNWTSGGQTITINASTGDNAGIDDIVYGSATSFQLEAGHIYKITAKHSGKALEVAGSAQEDGANVQQWAYSSTLNQQWMAEDAGGGAWRLTPQHSLKSLDVFNASTADGANVDQWNYIGADNEKWLFTDLSLGSANASIGTVNPVGSGTLSGAGIYTIKGSGLGIAGTADKGHLYYDKLTGNGSIIAKVLTMQNTNASAKAGIMIRETTATGSKSVFLAFTPNGTVNFQRRTALNGTTTNTTVTSAIPSWVRLTRVGNTFTAHRSTNGTTWTAVGSAVTVSMASDVLIGLAVSSNTSSTACTATFRNVTLTGNITRLN